MDEVHDLLTSLHGITAWLVVVTGAVALGVAVAALVAARPFGRTGRRLLWVFLATLVLQAILGVVIALVAPSEPFDGSTSTLVWHALGGVLAIAFTATALLRSRRRPTRHRVARAATTWTALAVLSVGDVVIGIALAGVVTVVRLLTAERIEPAAPDEPERRLPESAHDGP